jgi:hypothetical protein
MTYRVEYNGSDIEVFTLDAAIEDAKDAIAADVGPISAWTIEHDETINDWFIQGLVDGAPVGATAVVTGPEPTTTPTAAQAIAPAIAPDSLPGSHRDDRSAGVYRSSHASAADDEWVRSIVFTGVTPAEVFGKATTWLARHPAAVAISDVGWRTSTESAEAFQLRIHYQGEA